MNAENEFTLKMFENYPQPEYYIPDNRPKPKECPLDEIVIGGTAIHTFAFNFHYSEVAERFQIVYVQSITEKVLIDSTAFGSPYEIYETEEEIHGCIVKRTYITVTLSAEVTETFNPYDKVYAQAKIYLKNGDIVYAHIDELIVKKTIEHSAAIKRVEEQEE